MLPTEGIQRPGAAYLLMQRWLSPAQIGIVIAISLPLGWWACTVAARNMRVLDPGNIVWDEVVAFWIVLCLVILTDQKGLYTGDPRKMPEATFVHEALAGDPALESMAGGAGSSIGRGGMLTKILAAKRAAGSGASTVIAWGREPDVLIRLTQGEAIGTLLTARTAKKQARKQWISDHLQLRGAVMVDA